MARFSPEQIYAFVRRAGFSRDQAATMTALALAERAADSYELGQLAGYDYEFRQRDVEFGIPQGVPVAPAEAEYVYPFDVGGVVGQTEAP